jgi:hypothetical protein
MVSKQQQQIDLSIMAAPSCHLLNIFSTIYTINFMQLV